MFQVSFFVAVFFSFIVMFHCINVLIAMLWPFCYKKKNRQKDETKIYKNYSGYDAKKVKKRMTHATKNKKPAIILCVPYQQQKEKNKEKKNWKLFLFVSSLLRVMCWLFACTCCFHSNFFDSKIAAEKKAIKTLKKHKIELNFDEWKNHQVRIQCDAQQGKKRNNYR